MFYWSLSFSLSDIHWNSFRDAFQTFLLLVYLDANKWRVAIHSIKLINNENNRSWRFHNYLVGYLELLDHARIIWTFVANRRIDRHHPRRDRTIESDVDNDMLKELVLGSPARPITRPSSASFRGWWLSWKKRPSAKTAKNWMFINAAVHLSTDKPFSLRLIALMGQYSTCYKYCYDSKWQRHIW